MKFLKLQIKNIAGLIGPHNIDFTELAKLHNIFAITGKTGTGKSTILNCISMALYGQHYKKSLHQSDIVSLGAHYGKIELTFESEFKIYTASWECRTRKKDGQYLKTAKILRSLSDEQGTVLPIHPESVLPLNFEQFCKTIILNQGEFHRFLISNFSERKDILETLYGSQYLSKTNKILHQQIKDLKSQEAIVLSEIKGSSLFEPSHAINLRVQLDEHKTQLSRHELVIESINKLNQLVYEFNQLHQTIKNQKLKHTKFEVQANDLSIEINGINIKIQKCQKDLDDFLSQYENKKKSYVHAISIKNQLTHDLQTQREKEQQIGKIKEKIAHKNELESKMRAEIAQLEKILIQSKQSINWPHLTLQQVEFAYEKASLFKEKSLKQQSIKDQIKQISNSIAKNDQELLSIENSLDEVTNELKQYENIDNHIMKLRLQTLNKEFYAQEAKFEKDLETLELYKQIQVQLSTQQQLITQLSDEKTKIENVLSHALAAVKEKQLQQAIKLCLEHSIESGNCIVCHGHLDDTQALNQKNQVTGQTEICDIENLEINLKNIDQKYNLKIIEIKSLKSELNKLQVLVSSFSAEFIANPVETKNKFLQAIGRQTKDLENSFTFCQELQLKRSTALQKQASINKLKIESNKQLSQLQTTKQQLQSDLEIIIHELKTILGNEIEENISEILFSEIKNQNILIQNQEKVSNKSTSLENMAHQTEEYSEQVAQIQIDINNHVRRISESTKDLKKISPELNPEEQLKKIESIYHLKKDRVSALTGEAKTLELKYQYLLEQLNQSAKIIDDSYRLATDYLGRIKLFPLDESTIDKEIAHHHKKIQSIQNLNAVDDSQLSAIFEVFITVLMAQLNSHNKAKNDINKIVIEINTQMKFYYEKLKQQFGLRKKIKALKKKIQAKINLQNVLGREEFRNYALSIVQENLLWYANAELKSLCMGQYKLIQRPYKSQMEFYIVDYYHAAQHRKISTLSGGETFMVSLAMALGLAEMTRGKVAIDSFFIDEGFGALDEESLDQVREVLFDLDHRGKQIGIISHIRPLTDQIPVNLHLEKHIDGKREINIVYN